MGRRELRRMAKHQAEMDAQQFYKNQMEERKVVEQLVQDAVASAENFVKHHITGELYTAAAIILRKPPYRWGREKVLRYLEKIGAIINMLNDGSLTDLDLVEEGESVGIKVVWDANHEFIEEMDIFEEMTDGVNN